MDLNGARVAVTGATGFIGRNIVHALRNHGAHVIGVVRNPAKVPALAASGVELRKADLADVDALAAGFDGVDAVISNAGLIGLGDRTKAELIATNVQGTRNVVDAMKHAGVRRIVMTSSATAYRPRRDHHYKEAHALREATDFSTRFTHYAVSKAVGETEAWRLAESEGLELTTIRPQAVHGAFDTHSLMGWLKWLNAGPVGVWLSHIKYPSVYCGDLAEAFCLALEHPVSIGRAYNITGEPDQHDLWDLLDAWREVGGELPSVVLPLPVPIRRCYDITRAKADLGWTNRPLVEGFRELRDLELQESA
jgi:nucleoside-diphosphate-sugar epimerase